MNYNAVSNKNLNSLEEHRSYKYMVMSQRKNACIPCINSINTLSCIADLSIDSNTTDANILP